MIRAQDEIVVTGSDLKALFLRLLPRLKQIAWVVAVVSILFLVLKKPQFRAEATFQIRKDPAQTQVVFKEVFHVLGARIAEPSPLPKLLSKELCLDVIEQLGLQIESEECVFNNFKYTGSQPLRVFLKPMTDRSFEILDRDQKVLVQGEVNQRIDTPLFQGELAQMPPIETQKIYSLMIVPEEAALAQFQSVLKIRPSLLGDHMFDFQFTSPIRRLADIVIKQVILSYQKRVRLEAERSLNAQMEYLSAREAEYMKEVEEELGSSFIHFELFKNERHLRLLNMVSQLIEAKKMEKELLINAFAPVELVYRVIDPRKRDLCIYPLVMVGFSCGFFYLFHLCRTLFLGLPLSHETLRVLGWNSLGVVSTQSEKSLSFCSAKDLETLQNISHFLFANNGVACALIGGKNPNFSKTLAELLHLQGLRVLLIEDQMGEGTDTPCVHHGEQYDCTTYRHGIEMLKPTAFSTWLTALKAEYDRIVIYTQADAQSAQGKLYVHLVDAAVVSIFRETKEQLTHYLDSPHAVAFVTTS